MYSRDRRRLGTSRRDECAASLDKVPSSSALILAYPEVGAGGFTRHDGTIAFYQRVRALLRPDMTVLDFGAGRGRSVEDPVQYRRTLRTLRGSVTRVIGVDIDPVVLQNPTVDEARVVTPGNPLPLPSQSIDLVVSDFTFEHIADASWAASELTRVLRFGGWLCARTPNRWGYIGIGARLVPNRLHARVLRRLQPEKQEQDTFPTVYRMNTHRAIRRLFPEQDFDDHSFALNGDPAYCGSSRIALRIAAALVRLVPPPFETMLHIFMRRRETPT
jgi:SAM-dependent methyltransferase